VRRYPVTNDTFDAEV